MTGWESTPLLDADGDGCRDSDEDPDDDNDGFNDGSDLCPGTPQGVIVYEGGCSAEQGDNDEDGTNGAYVEEDDGTDDNGVDDGKDVDDADVHLSMRQVIAMMLTRLKRKSARAEVQETCQTDHARAAVRACGPRGIFLQGIRALGA